MIGIFKSELLKVKSTTISRIWWLAPIILIVISFFLTGSYCVIDNFNWFYTTILPFTLTLTCLLVTKQEKNKSFRGILSLPVSRSKIIYSKILVIVLGTFLSLLLIFAGSAVVQLIMGEGFIHSIPVWNMLLAVFVLTITFIWEIPLLLLSGFKFGFFPTLIVNIILQMGFGIIVSIKDFWILSPYSYPSRLMIPLLKILPNGLAAVSGSETFNEKMLSYQGIFTALVVSLVIFFGASILAGRWMEKREAI